MFNLSRLATLSGVVRSFGVTRKVFASTRVLADSNEAADTQKREASSKPKSEKNIFAFKTSKFKNIFLLDPTVAAIFKSLNDPDDAPAKNPAAEKQVDIDEIILNAKTVNGLLGIAEARPDINRTHALKVSLVGIGQSTPFGVNFVGNLHKLL